MAYQYLSNMSIKIVVKPVKFVKPVVLPNICTASIAICVAFSEQYKITPAQSLLFTCPSSQAFATL